MQPRTSLILVAACWIAATVLFALIGFDVVTSEDWNLTALGLALTVGGFLVQLLWPTA